MNTSDVGPRADPSVADVVVGAVELSAVGLNVAALFESIVVKR